MRHVVLLRGINVGPRNRIAMPDLRELLTSARFEDVATYLQSGNVVLSSETSPKQVAKKCEAAILAAIDLEIAVVVRSRIELTKVVALDPLGEVAKDPKLYQVGFCSVKPPLEIVRRLDGYVVAPERLVAVGRELYACYPNGIARSRLAAQMTRLDSKLTVTARNWRTVTKLLAMTEGP